MRSAAATDVSDAEPLEAFIRHNLPLAPVEGLRGILLHRAKPTSGLWRLATRRARQQPPYWAYPWPGGLCLARHVIAQPDLVRGRRVLDLGAGGGLVAIAAAKAGAAAVTAAETDPDARIALGLNAAANGVTLDVVAADLTPCAAPPVDIVLVGDLFYAKALAARVTGFLRRCRVAGCMVVVGDVGRAFLPCDSLNELAAYLVPEFGDGAPTRGVVYLFEAG